MCVCVSHALFFSLALDHSATEASRRELAEVSLAHSCFFKFLYSCIVVPCHVRKAGLGAAGGSKRAGDVITPFGRRAELSYIR